MSRTLDLGRRIALVPMDPHCRNITLALYRQQGDKGPEYLVHSYSGLEGVARRIEFVTQAAGVLGGLELEESSGKLRFPCGTEHRAAARWAFFEASKLPSTAALTVKPLSVFEKKTARNIAATKLDGGYQVTADGPEEGKSGRVEAVARGLRKLAEMVPDARGPGRVAFSCGHSHDALVGLLLPRALNVRATLREQEAAAGSGTLAAPSQQK